MIARVANRFHQLAHHRARCGTVRVSHAEIDHIELCCASLGLHLVDDGKYVRRQLGDAVKLPSVEAISL